jgi:hypothetical protein
MPALLRLAILACGLVAACGPPEIYYRNPKGSGPGAAGTGAAGTGLGMTTGAAGIGGPAGVSGQAGVTGEAGTSGAAGGTGVAGTSGLAGTNGAAGLGGAAGTTGTMGSAGTGASNAAGTSGTAGTTGAAGSGGGTFINGCSRVHWTAMASTTTSGTDGPANALDGNIQTRWGTGGPQKAGMYFQVDFGAKVSLNQVVLDTSTHQGDYPRGYDIGLSDDGTTFTSAMTGTPASANVITINFPAAQGRYLRITLTGMDGLWWSIDELRVGGCTVPGAPAGAIDPYDPANWKATASRSGGGEGPEKAIDGDKNTRWSTGSNQMMGDTFTIDLGGVAQLTEVWLDHGGGNDWPAVFKLELSADNTTWMEFGSGAGMQLNKVVFARRGVRGIRVTQTGSAARFWAIYDVTIKP